MKHSILRWRQAGFTLIELMIGMAVGLFILLGATSLMVGQIGDHRRLMLETRTEQDVRILAELLSQELKRVGSWIEPTLGIWSESNSTPQSNPHADVTISDDGSSVTFSYWHTMRDPAVIGFKRDGDIIRRMRGTTWQPITDQNSLKVTRFHASLRSTRRSMDSLCSVPCDGAENCPPAVEIRELIVAVEAEAAHDQRVKRDFEVFIRLPSDRFTGACRAV
jgi:prepilin peptidase dependent protein B